MSVRFTGRMNKARFVAAVAERHGMTRRDAAAAVDAVLDTLSDTLTHGSSVAFVGFGTFTTRERAARAVRNPRTGETSHKPATTVAKWRPAPALLEAVARGAAEGTVTLADANTAEEQGR